MTNKDTKMIPVVSGTQNNPTQMPIGSVRFNTQLFEFEYYNGTQWVATNKMNEPKTVWGWLERFATDDFVVEGKKNRFDYVNHKMHMKFPGDYYVQCNSSGEWGFVFAQPELETLFWLKYA